MPEVVIRCTYGRHYYDITCSCDLASLIKGSSVRIHYSVAGLFELINISVFGRKLDKIIRSAVSFLSDDILDKIGI